MIIRFKSNTCFHVISHSTQNILNPKHPELEYCDEGYGKVDYVIFLAHTPDLWHKN